MRSSRTRYTIRCSAVSRRLHTSGPRCFRGSGLPIPLNGSRMTASTIASARRAVRGLASTHHTRSSRNSGWKTETRWRLLGETKLGPQLGDGLCRPLPSERAAQRGEEALPVLGRAQQVCGLDEALELAGGHEGYGFVTPSIDDDHDPIGLHLLQQSRKMLPHVGVGGVTRHAEAPTNIDRSTVHVA